MIEVYGRAKNGFFRVIRNNCFVCVSKIGSGVIYMCHAAKTHKEQNTKCDTQKTGIGWMHKKKGKGRGRQAGQTERQTVRQTALTQNDAKSKHKQTKPMVQTELADRFFVFVFFLVWFFCLGPIA